MACREIQAAEN